MVREVDHEPRTFRLGCQALTLKYRCVIRLLRDLQAQGDIGTLCKYVFRCKVGRQRS